MVFEVRSEEKGLNSEEENVTLRTESNRYYTYE